MNYPEGIKYMKDLTSQLKEGESSSFSRGDLKINYPGYKKEGDYKLTINGSAPTHIDIINDIYEATSIGNIEEIITFLDDVYKNGLNAISTTFNKEFIEKIYWVTLQEEINYPQPSYKGRKLPFQRFYEGALAKVTNLKKSDVELRTKNHGSGVPRLYKIKDYTIPTFYK